MAIQGGKPDNPPPGTTLTFTADGKVLFKEGGDARAEEGKYKADPKKDPPEIDLSVPGGQSDPIRGIYKIDGDTLTLCLSMDGTRPKEFASPAGTQLVLVTCQRAKKE